MSGSNKVLIFSDVSLFLGLYSNSGYTNWFWENGTMVTESNNDYPRSDLSICEQMSVPLTYYDGINLLPKLCDQEAYFACEVECKTILNINYNAKQMAIKGV